jgi:hypothetical protein
MNRNLLIGLGLVVVAATAVIAVSLASAGPGNESANDDDAILAPPQPSPSPPAAASPPASPPPDTPVASQPQAIATVPGDAPVRSGLPPTTPPGAVATPRPAPPQPPAGNVELVEAPIEKVDVLVRESFPPGYTAHVVAGLPSGCASPATYELERSGTEIEIRVLNQMTLAMFCTQIYGNYELNIDLGTDFRSGVEYSLQVNEVTYTFTAQ